MEYDACSYTRSPERDLSVLRSSRGRDGRTSPWKTAGDEVADREKRRGSAVTWMVGPCWMRHEQLRVLLGDGWREPGLRRHGSCGDRGYPMKKTLYRLVVVAAAGSTFYTSTSD